jgi:hypothetical protein
VDRALIAALAVLAVAVAAAPARAEPTSPSAAIARRLDEGKRLFAELEYRGAIRALSPLRTDVAASRAQRLSALELIGIGYLILGEKPLAIQAFEDLLAIDPGYALQHDDGSPKIREFFEEVRGRAAPGFDAAAAVELEHAVPSAAVGARRVEIEATVKRGAASVAAVALAWRRRGVLAYQTAAMRRIADGRFRGAFVAPPSRTRYEVDYYLEAKNAAGGALGRIGGPENPLALAIEPGVAESRPWYASRWTLVGGAAVVAAGVVALVVVTRDEAPEGSLGSVTLTP